MTIEVDHGKRRLLAAASMTAANGKKKLSDNNDQGFYLTASIIKKSK